MLIITILLVTTYRIQNPLSSLQFDILALISLSPITLDLIPVNTLLCY